MLDWDNYIKVANKFQYKARREDREDLRQEIILRLAQVELKYNGNGKTLSIGGMIRAASYIVAEYWRKELRHPPLASLNTEVEDGDGNRIELIETVADDRAISLSDWLDARLWLYRCPERLVRVAFKKGAGSCQARYLNSKKFEGLVINKIKEHILTEDNLRELVRLVNEEMDSVAGDYRDELGVITDEISGINGRLERLYDALETGKLGLNDLAPRIQQLRYRQEQLQSRKWELETLLSDRRVELTNLETVRHYVDDLKNLLEESSLTERKSFIRSFVKEVKVTGDEVLLTYTIPLPPRGISEERLGVLCSVHYGGPWGTVPELLFEKKGLIPDLQQLIATSL